MTISKFSKRERWPQSLRHLELFSDCSPAELERIGSLLTGIRLDAGDVLVRQGVYGRQFMIIAEGDARVTQGRTELGILGPGAFVGEMALLDSVPRSATVTARTPLNVYVCNPGEFSALLRAAPTVRDKILQAAADRTGANEANRAKRPRRAA